MSKRQGRNNETKNSGSKEGVKKRGLLAAVSNRGCFEVVTLLLIHIVNGDRKTPDRVVRSGYTNKETQSISKLAKRSN